MGVPTPHNDATMPKSPAQYMWEFLANQTLSASTNQKVVRHTTCLTEIKASGSAFLDAKSANTPGI